MFYLRGTTNEGVPAAIVLLQPSGPERWDLWSGEGVLHANPEATASLPCLSPYLCNKHKFDTTGVTLVLSWTLGVLDPPTHPTSDPPTHLQPTSTPHRALADHECISVDWSNCACERVKGATTKGEHCTSMFLPLTRAVRARRDGGPLHGLETALSFPASIQCRLNTS